MDTDKLAFLDETSVNEADTQQTVAPVELPATGEIEVVPPATTRELPTVPLTAVLDEREKRQAAQREVEDLRRQLQGYQQPQELVDILEDPEARLAHERSVFQQELINTKLDTSRFLAVEKFGEDLVNAAYAFFDAPENRHKTSEFIGQPSPFHAAVKAYQQHQTMAEVGTDPIAYRGKIEAEIRAQVLAEMQQQAVQTAKPRPPISLSSAPSAGAVSNNTPLSKGSAFDAAFGG